MAAQDYVAVVQQLYISYFGRPADYFGLQNFTAQLNTMGAPKTFAELNAVVQADKAGTSAVSKLVNSFNTSPESVALYGTDNSPLGISKFLVTVFQNVIGRTPELGPGWDFWFNALSSGALRRADAAMAITDGALANTSAQGLIDAAAVKNKQAVATAFTNALDTPTKINAYSTTAAIAVATGLLKEVTATTDVAAYQATVLVAVDTVVAGSIPSTNAVLTKLVDTIVGGNGNDTVTATIGNAAPADDTFNPLDSIDGGAGVDTLAVLDIAGGTALPGGVVIKNVENISFRSAGALTFDQSTFSTTGLTKVIVTQAAAVTLDVAATTAVDVSGATGAVDVDGGSSVTVATASSAVTIGGTVGPKGAITVTNAGQAAAAIAIDGGTSVSVTTKGVSTGTVAVGAATPATGAVVIASTGVDADAATDVTLGAVSVVGGSKVTIVQTAAGDQTAAATDTSAQTVTQSAISVTGGKATEVSITQSAAQAAENYVAAVAAAKQTQTITFGAMATGETLIIAGLTFTASKALTAAEAAFTFSSIASAGVQGKSFVANGIYSGALTGFAAAASSGATVVLTEATAGTNAAAVTNTGTAAGTTAVITSAASNAATDLVEGVLGIVGGAVTIDDSAGGKLTTVSLNGTGAATVVSDKLTSLSLSNTDQGVAVTNTAATTLALALDNAFDGGTVALGATYTTVNLAANANDSEINLTAAGVKALNVSGTAAVDLSAATLSALETLVVTGSAGITIDASGATVKSVSTAGTTGSATVSIDATLATYTGGAGVDSVTTTTDASTKAIALGAGNDTLTLWTGTTSSTATLSGGDGTDTLRMAAADAVTLSGNATFEGKIEAFEKVRIDSVAASGTVDLSNLDDISYVISNGVAAAQTLTLTKMGAAGTLEIIGANAGTAIAVTLADATGTADVLNLVLKSAAGVAGGVVQAAGVETINLTVTDTAGSIQTSTVTLTDAALKTAVVTGNGALTLTLVGSTAVTMLDGSAMSGKLTATTNGTVGQTIKGGAAGDALTSNIAGFGDTLNGGAGNDTLVGGNLTTLIGGAGNDTFNVATATTNVNSYSTITDLTANDIIKFAASATTFATSKVVLADTAVFQDYANAAINATDTGNISWFQIGGNTYVIQNVTNGASFLNGTDIIVKVTGLVDLSHSSFSSSNDTLLYVG